MKNLILALVALFTLASCQEQKIGYVDNGKVINEIQEKKDIETKYDLINESSKSRADSLGRIYQAEYNELQVKAARLSEKKQQELLQPFQMKVQQYQQGM